MPPHDAPPVGHPLPRWPLTVLLVPFLGWWLLGLGTLVWPLASVVMAILLWRRGGVRVPKGFGIWLFFLFWVLVSASQIDSFGRLIGAGYRLALYLACTVIFVYVYNMAREGLTRFILGVTTAFFANVVLGGYLGLLFPSLTITTPLSLVMPGFLLANDLVREIVFVGTTQYIENPWADRDPRPSAPFLYTNNWGNAYSLLLPLACVYFLKIRHTWRAVPVALLILLSVVPAFLTLNRGMFLGLAIAGLVVALRYLLMGDVRGILAVSGAGLVALLAVFLLPVTERLDARLDSSGTNDARLTVYAETLARTATSPLLGFGAPRPAEAVGVPAAGTQGQVWMVLFSHGYVGLIFFLLWLVVLVVKTLPRTDPTGVVINAVLIVTFVEVFYYGILVQGLAVAMLVAALGLRAVDPEAPSAGSGSPPTPEQPTQLLQR